MKFDKAAKNHSVVSALEAIEDKLRERGKLIWLTGDNEADITLVYENFDVEDAAGPYLVIKVTATPKKKIKESKFEEFSDYINEMVGTAAENWSGEIQECLSEIYGQVVLLNGTKVY